MHTGTQPSPRQAADQRSRIGRRRPTQPHRPPPTNAAASVAAGAAQPLPANALVLVRRLVAKPEHNGKRTCALSFDATGRRPGPACGGGSACGGEQMEPGELGALGEPQAQAAGSSDGPEGGALLPAARGTQAASHRGCHSARAQTNTHTHIRVRAVARAGSRTTCWHARRHAYTHALARTQAVEVEPRPA